jgi:hypothetical protein
MAIMHDYGIGDKDDDVDGDKTRQPRVLWYDTSRRRQTLLGIALCTMRTDDGSIDVHQWDCTKAAIDHPSGGKRQSSKMTATKKGRWNSGGSECAMGHY